MKTNIIYQLLNIYIKKGCDLIIKNIIWFILSLIIFLYAIHIMSSSLNTLANDKLKKILYNLTSNKYLGVLVGTIITAIIHSSSATSVILISLLNSHLLTLNQATWIILGANIGTTFTGLLIAFDIGKFTIYLCVIGSILIFFKNEFFYLGKTILALGLIFLAMDSMSKAISPLQYSPYFINLFSKLNNPITAIIAGTIFTAIIQSSTASVAVLQTLYQKGLINFTMATNVIYGQNIGTCITALIASINGDLNSKRLTLIHILLNLIGAIIFLITSYFIPFIDFISAFTSNYMMQIAYMHILFLINNIDYFLYEKELL